VKRGFKSQCEKRAIELRKQLGLESTSPLSATELSDQVNVTIWSTLDIDGLGLQDLRQLTEIDADSWSAFTLRIENKHLVVYNSSQSPARINSVCMHELSHIILGHELHNAHVSSEGHLVPSNYNKEQEDEADWLGGHLELNGFEMMRGVKNSHGMDHKTFSRFEMVLTGHYHVASYQDNIWYLGSQLEFFWSDAHDPKYFHIIDTETREIEKILNPYTLFHKVLYNDSEMDYNNYNVSDLDGKFVKVVVINKTDSFVFDRFIDRIQNQDIHELKIAETFEEFSGESVNDESVSVEDTTQMLDSYIDAVDTDLDKDTLKGLMRGLFVEAQSLEIV